MPYFLYLFLLLYHLPLIFIFFYVILFKVNEVNLKLNFEVSRLFFLSLSELGYHSSPFLLQNFLGNSIVCICNYHCLTSAKNAHATNWQFTMLIFTIKPDCCHYHFFFLFLPLTTFKWLISGLRFATLVLLLELVIYVDSCMRSEEKGKL